jgi:hypothetical protein
MARIFISYSRSDEVFARKLATSLSDAGADVWIDVQDIPAGMKWSHAVQEGLDVCDVMLVIISPTSMVSNNVEDEWQHYLDKRKPIIPVRWQPADVHFQLNRIQFVDFYQQDYGEAFKHLWAELERVKVDGKSRRREPAPEMPKFDMRAAIEAFYEARGEKDWFAAYEWLQRIRSHGKIPRTFKIDALEAEVREYVDHLDFERETAVKRQQWEQDAAREYEIIRVMAQHDHPERVWEALQSFWDTFEDYDPDELGERFKPMRKLRLYVEQSAISLFANLARAAKKHSVDVMRVERYDHADAVIAYMLLIPEVADKFARKEIPVFTLRGMEPSEDMLRGLMRLAK